MTSTRPWDVVISLVVLFNLAIAQPLLDLIGRNAQFLVAHDASRPQILLLALGITLGIPLALAALVLLVSAASRRAGAIVLAALLASITCALVVRILKELPGVTSLPGVVLVAIGVAAAAGFALAFSRRPPVRSFLRFGAPIPLIVAGLFLFASPVSRILFPPDLARASESARTRDIPVVLIVFDELPVTSLMTRDARIDRSMFPNFGRLAADSTWFRNATTVDDATTRAVPAILDGRYPRENVLPIVSDHPQNLFTLLGPTHRVEAVEPLTGLCPFAYCERDAAAVNALVTDLTILGLHVLLPEDLADGLPTLEDTWAGFGEANPPAAGVAGRPRAKDLVGGLDREGHVRELVNAIEPSPKRSLYFLHLVSPHVPWDHLADGTRYIQSGVLGRGQYWEDDEWVARRGYQRHLMQLGFTDLLLGRILDGLEKARIYDDALIVAAADHGAGFEPGVAGRNIEEANVGSIAFIPLFVKEPGQREAKIVRAPVETIDIMPTITDVLGLEAPDEFDGRSLLAGNLPMDRTRRLPRDDNLEVGPEETPMLEVLEHKFELMGPFLEDLFALAPPGTAQLLERPVSEVELGVSLDADVRLASERAYADYDVDRKLCRCLIEGAVDGDVARGTPLAIAINGTIAGITQLTAKDRFAAMVKPGSFRDGTNEIEVYVISGRGDGAELRPLAS